MIQNFWLKLLKKRYGKEVYHDKVKKRIVRKFKDKNKLLYDAMEKAELIDLKIQRDYLLKQKSISESKRVD